MYLRKYTPSLLAFSWEPYIMNLYDVRNTILTLYPIMINNLQR